MKKHLIIFLLLALSSQVFSQQFSSGALRTNPIFYEKIGKAPLPIGSNIPRNVDLSSNMPPVGNQYQQNSCVAWVVAYANYSYFNKILNNCDFSENYQLNYNCLFSPSFIYNQINEGQNRGTYFQDAFRIMKTQGVAPLSTMPYIPNDWWTQPNAVARQSAANHKIISYWQLGMTGNDFYVETKAFLAKGIPVIASVKVDNYLKRNQNFPVPYIWNNWNGTIESMGHAILIVGYDDEMNTFKFINSYGPNWGNNGYGYISYNMYKEVLNEAFIIKPQNINQINESILAVEEKTLSPNDINAGLYFNLVNVEHFQFPLAYRPTPTEFFSKVMTFHGQVSIPSGIGKSAQVLIYFYLNMNGQKGQKVGSLNPSTRTLDGQAVTGTPIANLNPQIDFTNRFHAFIQYSDLDIPKGYPNHLIQTNLIAEPVLLIDGFPVRIGEKHYFFVRM